MGWLFGPKKAHPVHDCRKHSGCDGKLRTNSGEEIDCEHIEWFCSVCGYVRSFKNKEDVLQHILDNEEHELAIPD